jgi:hypothetical protein
MASPNINEILEIKNENETKMSHNVNENISNIDINRIVKAGKAIKIVFYAILIMICCSIFSLILLVAANGDLKEDEIIKLTYAFMAIVGLVLNIIILTNLYEAGDNLVNVVSIPVVEANYNSVIEKLNVNITRTGEFGEGGIIVYTDQNGEHGLVCSKMELGEATWNDSNKLCESYESDGFSDWRLPNINELLLIQNMLFSNKSENNNNQYYWSSIEAGSDDAWLLGHGQKQKVHSSKQGFYHVLAVRSF